MNPFNAMLIYRATKGLELVGEYTTLIAKSTIKEVAIEVKEPVAQLRKYQKVWKELKHPYIQRAAEQAQLSLPVVIELGTKASFRLRYHKNRIGLLVKLCSLVEGLGVEAAQALIAEKVSTWLEDQTRHLDVAYMHKKVGRDGKRRLTAALAAPVAARIDTLLHKHATWFMQQDPKLQYDQAYAKALTHKLLSTGTGKPEQFGPMFIIHTDYQFHADGTIATTDGALVNLKEAVTEKLAPSGWAAVTGTTTEQPTIPLVGALVKVHNRLADAPQRLAAILETLVCAWPGCEMPAAKCQIHHMKAHAQGGLTTGDNLTPLCKEHNGVNDDDPTRHRNGRMERDPITGRPGLRRYPDGPLIFNDQPITSQSIHHQP